MQHGFFTAKEAQSSSRPDGKSYSCASCGLYKDAKTPKMKPYGNFKKGILNIGIISKTDDRVGAPWQDESGRFLQKQYEKLGIDLFEDCLNINAVNCFCPNPGTNEVACCRKEVLKLIQEYQPKLIVLFGMEAVNSVIGHRWKKDLGKIVKWRGWTIPDQDLKCWICPIMHPVEVFNSEKHYQTVWLQDLERAVNQLEEKFLKYKTPNIITLDEDLSRLYEIKNGQVAFDYETTGLKPHSAGHKIVCASVAYSENDVFVFMLPNTKEKRKPFVDLLTNPNVGKIAQNMKFETHWTKVRLRVDVNPWDFDTMLATHVLDNRKDITGLKFQSYVQFGLIDYSSEIEPYLKAKEEKNANAINQIMKLVELPGGKEKLLKYCALDSINEYRLAMKQIRIMDYNYLPF